VNKKTNTCLEGKTERRAGAGAGDRGPQGRKKEEGRRKMRKPRGFPF
jgi:hypothetical protein